MKTAIIGIDPGRGGGISIVIVGTDGSSTAISCACPKNNGEIPDTVLAMLSEVNDSRYECIAYIEKQWMRPGMSSSTMTTMLINYAVWLGVLYCLKIDVKIIAPQTWIGYYKSNGIPELSKDRKKRKQQLKEHAQKLFPELKKKITLKTADSILIANYGRMKYFE